MTPRKASLRVAHQAHCPNATKTTLESVDKTCRAAKCKPSYYVFSRDVTGKPEKGKRVRDRQLADRALAAKQREIDEGRVGIVKEKNQPFPQWADEFIAITEKRVKAGELKPGTLTAYNETVEIAKDAIGYVNVRQIGPAELRRFYEELVDTRPASRVRHLKQLNVCLTAAVDEGLAATNPLTTFKKRLKLKVPKRGKAPFEDAELPRLWTAYDAIKAEPVYRYLSEFAVETGGRLGELIALDWTHLSLTERTLLIERSYDDEARDFVAPKDGEARTVYLTDEAVAVLQKWIKQMGARSEGPLFPNPAGGRLSHRNVGRTLDRAMAKAGIAKEHPRLRLPRTFHSLRYTTSNVLQRRGYHPRFIEQLLGHGSLELSYGVYGGWTPEQLAAEAAAPSFKR